MSTLPYRSSHFSQFTSKTVLPEIFNGFISLHYLTFLLLLFSTNHNMLGEYSEL